jgi:hypothetical protein
VGDGAATFDVLLHGPGPTYQIELTLDRRDAASTIRTDIKPNRAPALHAARGWAARALDRVRGALGVGTAAIAVEVRAPASPPQVHARTQYGTKLPVTARELAAAVPVLVVVDSTMLRELRDLALRRTLP